MPNAHGIERTIAAVYATPWALATDKLNQILSVLDRRERGLLDAEELKGFALPEEPVDGDMAYRVTAGGVAVLSLEGIISQKVNLISRFSGGTSTEKFSAAFARALADPAVKALVIDSNSPGGSINGVPELADQIFAARGIKPIVAVANTRMSSGAYWIGSAADKVIASPSAAVGGIGVYIVAMETSKADVAAGVKRTIVSAGKYKTAGNSIEPLTDEARARLQAFVDAGYDLFTAAVARFRGTTQGAVKIGYGQGDELLAADAKPEGLVDRIATLAEVIQELESKTTTAPGVPAARNPKGQTIMDSKLIAALFAKGLIAEQTEAAALAYFTARGEVVPTDAAAYSAELFAPTPMFAVTAVESLKLASAPGPTAADIAVEVVKQTQAAAKRDADYLVAQTTAICELMGLDATATAAIVAEEKPIAEARETIRQKVAAFNPPIPRLVPTGSEAERVAVGMASALEVRCMAAANGQWATADEKIPAAAKPFMGHRLIDIAAGCLRQAGIRVEGMSPGQIAQLALGSDNPGLMASAGASAYYGTGSFSNLTLNSARKVLLRAYQEAPVSWRKWVRQGESALDFKLHSLVKFGEVSDLDNIPEGRDFSEDSGLSDDREYYVVETYGKIVSFTRQMIVNDDLSALSRMPQLMGNAAARTFNKLVYLILTGNPNMADAIALFHATSHGANLLGTGSTTKAPPSVSTLNDMQAVLRKQHGLNSDTNLNTELRYLVVPAALEATTLALTRSITDPASTNANVPNIFYGRILPVVEALLDANSAVKWYAAADSGAIDTISVRFLQGEESPVIESWWEPVNDCRKFKVRQTGAAVLEDYRGLVAHTGYSA